MNQDNKKQTIIAGALGVVLVVVLVYQFVIKGVGAPPPSGSAAKPAAQAQQQTASAKPAAGAAAPATTEEPLRLKKVDVNLDELIQNIKVNTFSYDNEAVGRNPMTPLVGRVVIPTEGGVIPESLSLSPDIIRAKSVTGIIYNEFNPVAIVDDQVVTEGYQYPNGITVTRIEPKRVWFQWKDSQIPVDLKEL